MRSELARERLTCVFNLVMMLYPLPIENQISWGEKQISCCNPQKKIGIGQVALGERPELNLVDFSTKLDKLKWKR